MDDETYGRLVEVLDRQNENIDRLTSGLAVMSDQLSKRPTKKFVGWVAAIVASIVLSLSVGLSYAGYDSSHKTFEQIAGCIDPEGECAKAGAAQSQQVRGQIVCNQEKIVYFLDADTYDPLPFCADIINTELDRLGPPVSDMIPKVEVDPSVTQVVPLKDTFAEGAG